MTDLYTNNLVGPYGAGDDILGVKVRNLKVVIWEDTPLDVDGNDHATIFWMKYNNPNTEVPIYINVGDSISTDSGIEEVQEGTCIIFVQHTDNKLVFQPKDGIEIISPGKLNSYGKGSTVTLTSLSETVWVLGGDVEPNDVVM